jgi:hypothetical protein
MEPDFRQMGSNTGWGVAHGEFTVKAGEVWGGYTRRRRGKERF